MLALCDRPLILTDVDGKGGADPFAQVDNRCPAPGAYDHQPATPQDQED